MFQFYSKFHGFTVWTGQKKIKFSKGIYNTAEPSVAEFLRKQKECSEIIKPVAVVPVEPPTEKPADEPVAPTVEKPAEKSAKKSAPAAAKPAPAVEKPAEPGK